MAPGPSASYHRVRPRSGKPVRRRPHRRRPRFPGAASRPSSTMVPHRPGRARRLGSYLPRTPTNQVTRLPESPGQVAGEQCPCPDSAAPSLPAEAGRSSVRSPERTSVNQLQNTWSRGISEVTGLSTNLFRLSTESPRCPLLVHPATPAVHVKITGWSTSCSGVIRGVRCGRTTAWS